MVSRREFLQTSLAGSVAGAALIGPIASRTPAADGSQPKSPNDRWRVGVIGLRYQGSVIAHEAAKYGDIVAICDVDRHVREQGRAAFGSTPYICEDYRKLLERNDVDVVLIGAPDHWHTRMLIDACRAGKDVYCEKPLTLTIDEGKLINRVVAETGRVVQVGTWQRSDHRFRLAAELVRSGRIGELKKVTVTLGKNKQGGPFPTRPVPGHLNWDLWQGQTPDVPYVEERCHYTFRWWYEYSGGQMTDWGAHHVDIAQWGMGTEHTGPVEIHGEATFPEAGDRSYNVAQDYHARYRYANGVELEILDHGRNGVLFEGDGGRLFVNRGTVAGVAVDQLEQSPFPREEFQLYAHDNLGRPPRYGKIEAITNHMGNFYDCTNTRETPISNVDSQHRSVSVCHLGNISMRLGRSLRWDPEAEQFIDDPEANQWLSREQRKGFEIA